MLKEVLASNVAKMVAACVCPVVGAGAIALEVPQVRAAVHRATAPRLRPHRVARAKPRLRAPEEAARADGGAPLPIGLMCSEPIRFSDTPLRLATYVPIATAAPIETVRSERVYVPSACPSIGGVAGMAARFTSVPEPATWAQMIAGFAVLGGAARFRRREQAHTD